MAEPTTGSGAVPARRVLVVGLALLVASVAAGATPASAHDSTSQSVLLELNEERILVNASVPFAEIGYEDTSGDGLLDIDELRAQQGAVASTIVETVRDHAMLSVDGEDLQVIGAGVPGLSEIGRADTGSENVALAFVTDPPEGDVRSVDLTWTFDSPSTEVVLTHPDGVVAGELSDHHTVAFTLGTWASATSFFALGIDHIRFGPDHLLFLLVLTLAVAGTTVSRSTAWRTVKLVTAFTIGHAISLCLAYFEVISVPTGLVEPAIALSIVVAAVLVISGRTDGARPWIAGVIGLVHGLGFAASLAGLGLATSQRAPALAAFNVGIDVAQTAVVLMVLVALGLASKVLVDRMAWVRVPIASVAAVIGVAWMATRLTAVVA